ncbi:MAG: hypothetical protein JWN67_2689 [Actinomycetia bacterium]|nr:hypothetical protein [Actinomycetes bacterium]
MAPLQYLTRLTLGLALSAVGATLTYVVGTWALRQVIAVGLHVVPA